MSYPENKEIFRRVVNQLLPEVRGNVVKADDQNNAADFLERLQDALGYNFKTGYADLASRIDKIENGVPYKYHSTHGTYTGTITAGNIPSFEFGIDTPIKPGDKIILRISGEMRTDLIDGYLSIKVNTKIDIGLWQTGPPEVIIGNFKQNAHCGFSFTTEQIDITSGEKIRFRFVTVEGSGSGYFRGLFINIYVI